MSRPVTMAVLVSILLGCLLVYALQSRPAPPPPTVSVTAFIVCGQAAGILAVDPNGESAWYAEPIEPGFRAGLLSLATEDTLLVKIIPQECDPT